MRRKFGHVQGYLGYKKPELKKPYRILPSRFLNLRKRGPTDVGAQGFFWPRYPCNTPAFWVASFTEEPQLTGLLKSHS